MSDIPYQDTDRVADEMARLSGEVGGLRKSVDRKFETARVARLRSNTALGVAVTAALVGALVSGWLAVRSLNESAARKQEADAREQLRVDLAVAACLNGNASRAGVVEGDLNIGDATAAALGAVTARPDMTAEENQRRADLIAQLKVQTRELYMAGLSPALAARDCSPQAVSSPTTVPTLAPGR
jgi:hypothetical protein